MTPLPAEDASNAALSAPRGPAVTRRNLAAGFGVLVSAMVVPKSAKALCIGPICIGGGGGGGGGGGDGQCFVRGTQILTPLGETEIENLQPGDLVLTAFGEEKPILWVGRRAIAAADLEGDSATLPIRVRRFALSDTSPHRDLYLSRGHSVYIDGVLAPVGDFINDRSIAPCPSPDIGALEYFHIELQDHDVIVAEGAACETLLVADAIRFCSTTPGGARMKAASPPWLRRSATPAENPS